MSKKDFIALAGHLRGLSIPDEVMSGLMRFCRGQNRNFNEDRFRGYLAGTCGPCGGEIKKTK